jgi:tRNA (5-methylaminomethyl-2-thiouridylate)-methyltransferase
MNKIKNFLNMKVAVLISGGVDSSVALRRLIDEGHDVTAFYLKIWLEDELSYLGDCPWEEDLGYVRQICEEAGVPLQVISMQKEYWEEVVEYTLAEVKEGRTPNPDIFCNERVKFGQFYNKIDDSFEKVATGHYAQVEEKDGLFYLKKAPDPIKDQTYFLSHLSQAQLSRALFPIGDLSKQEVRALAQKYNLPNQSRKDSQGICFLGKIKFSEFLKHHLGEKTGDIIEFETSTKIGEHPGSWYYTIGQRQGLGLSGGPWFVVEKDTQKNRIYISRQYDEKVRDSFQVDNIKWITRAPELPGKSCELQVKVRHGEVSYPATLTLETENKGTVKIKGQDQGFAAGQFAVFYDGDYCLGSGMITG